MARPFRPLAEDAILDQAAGLFARHGYSEISVQRVATAVGLSKTGLLHHFPSKEALGEAVAERSRFLMREVVEAVGGLPDGPVRDRAALEILTDQALSRPGLTAFSLRAAAREATGPHSGSRSGYEIFEAFGLGPGPVSEREIRVSGALASLAMTSLLVLGTGRVPIWRAAIVQTAFDALGHGGPDREASGTS
jgi:AcrR family transcriptional regulator